LDHPLPKFLKEELRKRAVARVVTEGEAIFPVAATTMPVAVPIMQVTVPVPGFLVSLLVKVLLLQHRPRPRIGVKNQKFSS